MLFLIFTKEFRMKVEEVDFFLSSCESGVEPTQKGDVQHFFRELPLINNNRWPLSTLGFVTSNGVGKFNL